MASFVYRALYSIQRLLIDHVYCFDILLAVKNLHRAFNFCPSDHYIDRTVIFERVSVYTLLLMTRIGLNTHWLSNVGRVVNFVCIFICISSACEFCESLQLL